MLEKARAYVPIGSFAIAILSLGLAFYWRSQSVQLRMPTYYVAPERAHIVDVGGPAPPELVVLHHNKPITDKNVTAVRVYFWNDGQMPILKSDVLEPLFFELAGPAQVLEARILKASRKVSNFQLKPLNSEASNRIGISFGILERGDGAAIQIVFAGAPDSLVCLSGTIVGVKDLRILFAYPKRDRTFLYVLAGFGLLLTGATIRAGRRVLIEERAKGSRRLLYGMLIALWLVQAEAWYHEYQRLPPIVPDSISLER